MSELKSFSEVGNKTFENAFNSEKNALYEDSIRPRDIELPQSRSERMNDISAYSDSERISSENILPENSNFLGEKFEKNNGDAPEKEREVIGGSYSDVKKFSDGEKYEVHHMPADTASNLDRPEGPAIKMEKEDHRQTASCGSSLEAREYQANQKELIGNGNFREALQMDIDDIHEKFGSKYDEAISQMLTYVDKLETEDKI
ncbi:MAG: hypothetical protein NC253_01135 [Ruminococcus sp.]|nr:hypothetical protein [Ruminococcus sp.]MCM1382852.1 hypothetical protein [Muribaculaceae bacterium]MCM1479973.1 hypothetical protein [Muribaculaceae bacterium]